MTDPTDDSDKDAAQSTPPSTGTPPAKPASPEDDDRTMISEVVPAPPSAAPAPAAPSVPAPPAGGDEQVAIGTIINNNYEIKAMIQAGGMGEVYRGENTFTGDAVAIKIVLRSLAHDEKIAALFKREARILCQLQDQAIVRYYNFVHDAELDRFCLIMEFIDGIPLSDHVKENGPISVAEATEVMIRVAEGLGQAHEREVVHRDLSPDNVMLRGGDVHNAVLIDFGIAKSTEMTEGTLHGQFAGKFKYISPEQLGHYDGIVGPRTDVYGLALLIAAALIGEPLDMGSSVVEAVNKRREIPDLSAIDPVLRPLLAHMLEPDPTDRPARMSDVVRLIRNPSEVPAKYGSIAGAAIPQAASVPTQSPAAASLPPSPAALRPAVQGFQAPPAPGTGRLTTGLIDTDVDSASPFGAATSPPQSGATIPPRKRRKKRKSPLPLIVGAVAVCGLAWFVADRAGLLQSGAPATESAANLPDSGVADSDPASVPDAPALLTRETFLAGFDAGECSYATRITAGPNAGLLEGYSNGQDRFAGLPAAYEEAFGARPDVVNRQIDAPQCAAVAFARALQANGVTAPMLTLSADSYVNGGTVQGSLRAEQEASVWVFLVSSRGGVYNLTPRLEDQGDGRKTFSFDVTLGAGARAQPQLILAVASPSALINVAAAKDGAAASELLPLVQAEIAGRGNNASGAMRYFSVVEGQPAPAPDDETDGDL